MSQLERRVKELERARSLVAGCPLCGGPGWGEPVTVVMGDDAEPVSCPRCGRLLVLTIDLKGGRSGDQTAAEQA